MKNRVARTWGYILQVGITMIVPIALMGFVGVFLNKILSTDIAFVVCIVLGILAGFRNCYVLFKQEIKMQSMEDKKEIETPLKDNTLDQDDETKIIDDDILRG